MTIRMHPREVQYQKARSSVSVAVSNALQRNPDLTYLELCAILNEVQASWLRYGIKDERAEEENERSS